MKWIDLPRSNLDGWQVDWLHRLLVRIALPIDLAARKRLASKFAGSVREYYSFPVSAPAFRTQFYGSTYVCGAGVPCES